MPLSETGRDARPQQWCAHPAASEVNFRQKALISEEFWRATPDEDGQYVYAIALR
jgi:hypothetical protein